MCHSRCCTNTASESHTNTATDSVYTCVQVVKCGSHTHIRVSLLYTHSHTDGASYRQGSLDGIGSCPVTSRRTRATCLGCCPCSDTCSCLSVRPCPVGNGEGARCATCTDGQWHGAPQHGRHPGRAWARGRHVARERLVGQER